MPASGNVSVFGVYPDFLALRTSVEVLKSFGFRKENISVLLPDRAIAKSVFFGNRSTQTGSGSSVQPLVQPLIGGNFGWLTYIEMANPEVVSGSLIAIGVPSSAAQGYEDSLRKGEMLLCVRSQAEVAAGRAERILERNGARQIACATDADIPAPQIPLGAEHLDGRHSGA